MKLTHRLISLFMLGAISLGMAVPADVLLKSWAVEEDDAALLVRWEMNSESGVRGYRLLRKTASNVGGGFVSVGGNGLIPAQGIGHVYEVRDAQLFKEAAEAVTYRIEAQLTDGRVQLLKDIDATYTSTALRRTWGSIKAMFQ